MDNLEKITYLPNGQWQLEKGAMRRLAPKPKPKEHAFWDQAISASDPAQAKRGVLKLLEQHKNNPHAIKQIDGKHHILLHRGIKDYDESGKSSASNMKVDQSGISHKDNALYTDSYSYADSFADSGDPESDHHFAHSVWVPLDNIISNAHHEHDAWEKEQLNRPSGQFEGDPEALENYRTAYGEVMGRGNHIGVKGGDYKKATPRELKDYLEYHRYDQEPNEDMSAEHLSDESSHEISSSYDDWIGNHARKDIHPSWYEIDDDDDDYGDIREWMHDLNYDYNDGDYDAFKNSPFVKPVSEYNPKDWE